MLTSIRNAVLPLALSLFILCWSCSPNTPSPVHVLQKFPLDSLERVITLSDVHFDKDTSSDGGGSLRITVHKPTVIRLFETGDVALDNATILYQAKLRTENVQGQAYLEMWCHFPGKGAFFSRGLHSPLSGSTEWTSQEIPFFLRQGEDPDNIQLNLVIDGSGTVWIDDIRLVKAPLK